MEFLWHDAISAIDPDAWNGLAATSPTPLMTHEWLCHLEESGSITPDHQWTPCHLTVREGSGAAPSMIAAVPLYVRNGSWGEFVFDFAFADVAGQLGKEYYPKMVGMSPASPSPAFGFLTRPGRENELTPLILREIERFCRDQEIRVLQFNFVIPEWKERLAAHGMVAWEHHGYAWYNEEFSTFEDYLARFRKNQRRNIRRERASLAAQGLVARVVHAPEAPAHWFDRMADYYLRTNAQFGPYAARFLTREFFTEMPPEVARHVWFVAAEREDGADGGSGPDDGAAAGVSFAESSAADGPVADGHGTDGHVTDGPVADGPPTDGHVTDGPPADSPLALAMLVRKGDRVLGRYWGTREDLPNLHFNICYYEPIEWAINEGISVFDPGMGSEHKVRRGFRSLATYSLHRFFDPTMQAILEANMDRINAYERAQITMLDDAVPYK